MPTIQGHSSNGVRIFIPLHNGDQLQQQSNLTATERERGTLYPSLCFNYFFPFQASQQMIP